MPTLAPYAEKIVSDYLRDDPDVSAIVDRRVVGKTPSTRAEPWVRLTQIDGSFGDRGQPGHLMEWYGQLDCYAGKDGGQPEANLLARTVTAVLNALNQANHQAEGAVVTGASASMGARIPDTDVDEPARERFVVTATVWMHAT